VPNKTGNSVPTCENWQQPPGPHIFGGVTLDCELMVVWDWIDLNMNENDTREIARQNYSVLVQRSYSGAARMVSSTSGMNPD
jgi:hypothetical protein